MTFAFGSRGRAASKITEGDRVGSRPRGWLTGFVLLLIACLLIDGTAVQTHLHFAEQSPVSAAAPAASDHVSKPRGEGKSTDCPLCQEAAMAGAYLLPVAAVLPPPPAPVLWTAVAVPASFNLAAPAHAWRSRAPPQ